MRVTPTKVLYAVTSCSLLLLLLTIMRQRHNIVFTKTCSMSLPFRRRLVKLLQRTHEILERLELKHFLCYDSLIGQIRQSESPPWADKGEFCVFDSELIRYEENFLRRSFRQANLRLVYDSGEGSYEITEDSPRAYASDGDGSAAKLSEVHLAAEVHAHAPKMSAAAEADVIPRVRLVVFADDKEIEETFEPMHHRIGWKRRLLPPDCRLSPSLDCFPSRLAEPPLPLRLFGDVQLPAPREDIEILKYHFPNDWWKEDRKPPLNC